MKRPGVDGDINIGNSEQNDVSGGYKWQMITLVFLKLTT
jgi:hypothetical protein